PNAAPAAPAAGSLRAAGGGAIAAAPTPAPVPFAPPAEEIVTVEEMEKRLIRNALKKTKGNRNEAARLLGINVRTLRNKLNLYEQEMGVEAAGDEGE
ncbi:MAG TPA: helix-turn-helix domain-containing protein, partial [Candidatus Methylacidiphilales bacterium]